MTSTDNSFCFATNNAQQLCTIFQLNFASIPYTKTEEYNINSEDNQDLTDLKYVNIGEQWVLVLAFADGVKVYSEDGKRLLTFIKIQENNKNFYQDPSNQNYFQGITSAKTEDKKEIICVGNSLGEVYFIEKTKESIYSNKIGVTLKGRSAITQIAHSSAHNLLFISDSQGLVHIYSLATTQDVKLLKTIDTSNQNNPITSLCVGEAESICYLFVADMLGKLRIYDVLTFALVADVAAHFRAITSIQLNKSRTRLITTSEDTYLNVWKINLEKGLQLHLMMSYNSEDKMIVGGYILEKPNINVMIAQYECDEISVLTSLN